MNQRLKPPKAESSALFASPVALFVASAVAVAFASSMAAVTFAFE